MITILSCNTLEAQGRVSNIYDPRSLILLAPENFVTKSNPGIGCGENFISYKNIPGSVLNPYALWGTKRISTQDAVQINALYECPLEKVLVCKGSSKRLNIMSSKIRILAKFLCDWS